MRIRAVGRQVDKPEGVAEALGCVWDAPPAVFDLDLPVSLVLGDGGERRGDAREAAVELGVDGAEAVEVCKLAREFIPVEMECCDFWIGREGCERLLPFRECDLMRGGRAALRGNQGQSRAIKGGGRHSGALRSTQMHSDSIEAPPSIPRVLPD